METFPTPQPYQSVPVPESPAAQPQAPVSPPKSRRMLWMVLAGVLIIGAAAYGWMKLYPSSPAVLESASPSPTATTDATAGWKTYTNTEFGFQLTFTDEWAGYYVIRHTLQRSDFPAGTYFDNEFQKQKGNVWLTFNMKDLGKDYPVFAINVYPKTYWIQVQNDPPPGKYLGEQSGFVFTATGAQEGPSDPDLAWVINNPNPPVSTFRFIK